MLSGFAGRADYLHIDHPITPDLDIDNPISYYFDLKPKFKYSGRFDSKGVFLLNHYSDGWIYYPISIFNFAIAAFQNYLSDKEPSTFSKLISQLNWATNTQEKTGPNEGGWKSCAQIPVFGLKKGWISGMAQGLGISALLRGWMISRNEEYLETAHRALIPFKKNVVEGGVARRFEGRLLFFEEYPSTPPSYVLNGFISSMLGLRDLWVFAHNQEAEALWNESIESLKAMIPKYDLGYWSRYDLSDSGINVASSFYHRYHSEQLRLMYLLTGEDLFHIYSKRFSEYAENRSNWRKAFLAKVRWRLRHL